MFNINRIENRIVRGIRLQVWQQAAGACVRVRARWWLWKGYMAMLLVLVVVAVGGWAISLGRGCLRPRGLLVYSGIAP